MRALGLLLCLVAGPALAQTTQSLPFRRVTDPLQLPVSTTATATMVPQSLLRDPTSGVPLTSFLVVNPNNVWVRTRGFSTADDCNNVGVTATTGWLLPPGFIGVFSTQNPVCGSTLAVSMPGFEIKPTTTFKPIEWSYGPGQ